MLVAQLASRLLYFLFGVTTHGLVALVALATVVPSVPGASSGGATVSAVSPWCSDLEGKFRLEDTRCCPLSCMRVRWVRYCSLCIWGLGGSCWAKSAASVMAPIGVRYSRSAAAAKALLRFLYVMPMFISYLNCITNHSLKNLLNLFCRSSSRSPPPDFPLSRHRAVLFFRRAAHPFSFSTGPTVPSHHHRVAVGSVRLPGRDHRCRARVPSFLFSYFVQIHFISLF
jgi:hypothetical protein